MRKLVSLSHPELSDSWVSWVVRCNDANVPSFAGLSTTEYSSKNSIQGKPGIYKRGGKNLRDMLYICPMNAIKANTAYKALYQRLRANGKTGKQVFAAVKNNTSYPPD